VASFLSSAAGYSSTLVGVSTFASAGASSFLGSDAGASSFFSSSTGAYSSALGGVASFGGSSTAFGGVASF